MLPKWGLLEKKGMCFGVYSKRKKVNSFSEGAECGVKKTGSHKVVSLVKWRQIYQVIKPPYDVRILSINTVYLASKKVNVLNHPPYSPDMSPCDFFLFPSLKAMLSGNKYTSRSSLDSAIYQCLLTDTKRRLFICFSRLGKKVTKMYFSKGGILWRFVIKIRLIKRSTEVIWTQWQNFLQNPRTFKAITQDLSIAKQYEFRPILASKHRRKIQLSGTLYYTRNESKGHGCPRLKTSTLIANVGCGEGRTDRGNRV